MNRWIILLILAFCLTISAQDYLEVGFAEIDITPEIAEWEDTNGDGQYTFGDGTPYDTGEKVISFKDGDIYVGNGKGKVLYVHDRIFNRILVIHDPVSGNKVALISCDLYMMLKPECDFIRKAVADMGFTHIAIHSTHSHMGPDTLGRGGPDPLTSGINGKWLRKMQRNTANGIRKVFYNRTPANLRFLTTSTRFGLNDTRDPVVYDDDLTALQAVDRKTGKVLVTMVQWSNHVEAILGIHNGNDAPPEMKEKTGHIITAGFPGHVATRAKQVFGGHGIFFNGSVGGLLTMLRVFVWEPFQPYSPDTPIENIPQDYPGKIHDNFKMAELIGNELIDKVYREGLSKQRFAENLSVNAKAKVFKTPLDNKLIMAGFLAGIVGYDKRKIEGDIWERPYVYTEVSRITIGPAEIICVPGELVSELSKGLPEDFYAKNGKYFRNPEHHKTGKDFVINDSLKGLMKAKYKFVFGLTNDSLGYMVAPCDFKLDTDYPWFQKAPGHYEETQSSSKDIVPNIFKTLKTIANDK